METSLSNVVYKLLSEPTSFFFLGAVLAFFYLTFNSQVASIYGLLLLTAFIGYLVFKPPYTFSRVKGNSLNALFIAILAFGGVIVASVGAFMFLQSTLGVEPTPEYVLRHIQAAGESLIFSQSKVLTFFTWGFIIPYIETIVFGYILQVLAILFSINTNLSWDVNKLLPVIAILVLMSGSAVFFHIQAKGITDNPALIITFVFFFITGILILLQKEMESAIYLHIINNVFTVGRSLFGWFV